MDEPPPPPSGPKRLTKSHDRKLGGVAGGLAEYFDADPALIRVLFVVGLFVPGLGLGVVVAYVLMWFMIPDPEGEPPPRASSRAGGGGDGLLLFVGLIIVALGLLLLLRTSWVWTSWFGFAGAELIWPLVLVAIGAYIVYAARGRA